MWQLLTGLPIKWIAIGGAVAIAAGASLIVIGKVENAAVYKEKLDACQRTLYEIRRASDARRDVGTGSDRDRRLRDEFQRD